MKEEVKKATCRENAIRSDAFIYEEAVVKVGSEEALRRGVARGAIRVSRQGSISLERYIPQTS